MAGLKTEAKLSKAGAPKLSALSSSPQGSAGEGVERVWTVQLPHDQTLFCLHIKLYDPNTH